MFLRELKALGVEVGRADNQSSRPTRRTQTEMEEKIRQLEIELAAAKAANDKKDQELTSIKFANEEKNRELASSRPMSRSHN